MKKLSFLLTALLIGGMMLTGCKKPEPTPDPEPTPTTYTVSYKVLDTDGSLVLSPCFKLNVSYTDANGQTVTLNNQTLPWIKNIEVTAPFHAKMEGTFVYDEQDLPDQLVYGKFLGIVVYQGSSFDGSPSGRLMTYPKEGFIEIMAQHPDRLSFTTEKDI